MAESTPIEIPTSVTKFIQKVFEKLLDWKGITGFVKVFPDPIYALAGLGIIFGSALSALIIVLALFCSFWKERINARLNVDLVLARKGIVRSGNGRIRIAFWTVLILLGLALCIILVLGTLLVNYR
jgi:hypothetical protein